MNLKLPPPPSGVNYLDVDAVCAKLDISRRSLYRAVKDGVLPKPVKVTAGAARWREDLLDRAIAVRAAR